MVNNLLQDDSLFLQDPGSEVLNSSISSSSSSASDEGNSRAMSQVSVIIYKKQKYLLWILSYCMFITEEEKYGDLA